MLQGLFSPRPDLLRAFRDMRAWALRRVQAGETNIKSYVVLSGITKHFEGLLSGLEPEALYEASVEEAVTGFEEMLDVLKRHNSGDDAADTSATDFGDAPGFNVAFDMELAVSLPLMQEPWLGIIILTRGLQERVLRRHWHP